jgi:VanZ family protein
VNSGALSQSPSPPIPQLASSLFGKARIQALAWAAFLFTLTSWPSPPRVPLVSGIPNFDKLVHFTLYAVQSSLVYRSVRWPGLSRFSLARVLAVVGVMAVWGAVDETHQTWIPGRAMEGDDVAADVAGAAAGAAAASVLSRRGERAGA